MCLSVPFGSSICEGCYGRRSHWGKKGLDGGSAGSAGLGGKPGGELTGAPRNWPPGAGWGADSSVLARPVLLVCLQAWGFQLRSGTDLEVASMRQLPSPSLHFPPHHLSPIHQKTTAPFRTLRSFGHQEQAVPQILRLPSSNVSDKAGATLVPSYACISSEFPSGLD